MFEYDWPDFLEQRYAFAYNELVDDLGFCDIDVDSIMHFFNVK